MPSDATLAALSNTLINSTTALYALAALAFAAVFAYRREPANDTAAAEAPAEAAAVQVTERVLVGVGASGGGTAEPGARPPSPTPPQAPVPAPAPAPRAGRSDRVFSGETFGRYAVALTTLGWVVHAAALVTRGLAAHRVPWANMYEFVLAVSFAAITALLVMFTRKRTYYLGAFVTFPVVLGLGLAITELYTPINPLAPSLHSYWLAIHVLAAIVATGAFTVAAALAALYIYRDGRPEDDEPAREPQARSQAPSQAQATIAALAERLPNAATLERLARQTVLFAFPIWTFAIIAGAIWADSAWGRYWGWDPKETWAFVTWIVYAAHLHARNTKGWTGRKAMIISLVGYGCLLFNLIGINIWGSGLHSYAGV